MSNFDDHPRVHCIGRKARYPLAAVAVKAALLGLLDIAGAPGARAEVHDLSQWCVNEYGRDWFGSRRTSDDAPLCTGPLPGGGGQIHREVPSATLCPGGVVRFTGAGALYECTGSPAAAPAEADGPGSLDAWCRDRYGRDWFGSKRIATGAPMCSRRNQGGLGIEHRSVDASELCASGDVKLNDAATTYRCGAGASAGAAPSPRLKTPPAVKSPGPVPPRQASSGPRPPQSSAPRPQASARQSETTGPVPAGGALRGPDGERIPIAVIGEDTARCTEQFGPTAQALIAATLRMKDRGKCALSANGYNLTSYCQETFGPDYFDITTSAQSREPGRSYLGEDGFAGNAGDLAGICGGVPYVDRSGQTVSPVPERQVRASDLCGSNELAWGAGWQTGVFTCAAPLPAQPVEIISIAFYEAGDDTAVPVEEVSTYATELYVRVVFSGEPPDELRTLELSLADSSDAETVPTVLALHPDETAAPRVGERQYRTDPFIVVSQTYIEATTDADPIVQP